MLLSSCSIMGAPCVVPEHQEQHHETARGAACLGIVDAHTPPADVGEQERSIWAQRQPRLLPRHAPRAALLAQVHIHLEKQQQQASASCC